MPPSEAPGRALSDIVNHARSKRTGLQEQLDRYYKTECHPLFQRDHLAHYTTAFQSMTNRLQMSFNRRPLQAVENTCASPAQPGPSTPKKSFCSPTPNGRQSARSHAEVSESSELVILLSEDDDLHRSSQTSTEEASSVEESQEGSGSRCSSETDEKQRQRRISTSRSEQDETESDAGAEQSGESANGAEESENSQGSSGEDMDLEDPSETVDQAELSVSSTVAEEALRHQTPLSTPASRKSSRRSSTRHSLAVVCDSDSEDAALTESDEDESDSYALSSQSANSGLMPVGHTSGHGESLSPLPLAKVRCSFSSSPYNKSIPFSMSPGDFSGAVRPLAELRHTQEGDDDSFAMLDEPTQQYSSENETAFMVSLDEASYSSSHNTQSSQSSFVIETPTASASRVAPTKLPVLPSPKVFLPQLSPSVYVPVNLAPMSPIPRRLLADGPQSYVLTPPKVAISKADDSDDEEDNTKYIPKWARKENLAKQVKRQHERNPDPTVIFPIPNTCDLEQMFGDLRSPVGALQKKRKRPKNFLRQRGSSGCWDRDRVTEAEKENFRKKMRYQ